MILIIELAPIVFDGLQTLAALELFSPVQGKLSNTD